MDAIKHMPKHMPTESELMYLLDTKGLSLRKIGDIKERMHLSPERILLEAIARRWLEPQIRDAFTYQSSKSGETDYVPPEDPAEYLEELIEVGAICLCEDLTEIEHDVATGLIEDIRKEQENN